MSSSRDKNLTINNVTYNIPEDYEKIDYYCSTCLSLIYTLEDIESCYNNSICESCYNQYYYNNKEKWDKGWRPT